MTKRERLLVPKRFRRLLFSVGSAIAAGVPVLIGAAVSPGVYAQSSVAFEVASVKSQPWKGQGRVGVAVHGNTLSAEHSALYDLIQFAWNLKDGQLSGGPAWALHGPLVSSDLYQVVARADVGSAPSMDQFRLMLQTLLRDRFRLKVRKSSKDMPAYSLVVARNGPKLRGSPEDAKFALAIGPVNNGNLMRIRAAHTSISKVIGQFERYAGRPVFDRTGLVGFYDFEIEWLPDTFADADAGSGAPDTGPSGPSIFTALQNQLGLKLEPATAPFDMVVIDHAEKPSEN